MLSQPKYDGGLFMVIGGGEGKSRIFYTICYLICKNIKTGGIIHLVYANKFLRDIDEKLIKNSLETMNYMERVKFHVGLPEINEFKPDDFLMIDEGDIPFFTNFRRLK